MEWKTIGENIRFKKESKQPSDWLETVLGQVQSYSYSVKQVTLVQSRIVALIYYAPESFANRPLESALYTFFRYTLRLTQWVLSNACITNRTESVTICRLSKQMRGLWNYAPESLANGHFTALFSVLSTLSGSLSKCYANHTESVTICRLLDFG